MHHRLKCWPEFFEAVLRGAKRFELRRNDDRVFSVGDLVTLREMHPSYWRADNTRAPEEFTGREIEVRVLYVISGPVELHDIELLPAGVSAFSFEIQKVSP